jgi:hypothetical protein
VRPLPIPIGHYTGNVMVHIAVNRVIPDPEPAEWQELQTFEFGDGNWKLRFSDPFEWHMGADGWKAKLFHSNKDVSMEHPILKKSWKAGHGFNLPRKYSPWCRSKPLLALHPWDSAIHLYDVSNRKTVNRALTDFPLEIQWAPLGDLLAITCDGHIKIVNRIGEEIACIPVSHPKLEYPETFWWRDGKRILIICRESESAKSCLRILDSANGRLLSATDFDPADLIPYDRAAYASINRDRYSLHIGPRTRAVGNLLDRWSRLEFDNIRCVLRGTVYRPDGPPEFTDGEYLCAAKERGVEITVSA